MLTAVINVVARLSHRPRLSRF